MTIARLWTRIAVFLFGSVENAREDLRIIGLMILGLLAAGVVGYIGLLQSCSLMR